MKPRAARDVAGEDPVAARKYFPVGRSHRGGRARVRELNDLTASGEAGALDVAPAGGDDDLARGADGVPCVLVDDVANERSVGAVLRNELQPPRRRRSGRPGGNGDGGGRRRSGGDDGGRRRRSGVRSCRRRRRGFAMARRSGEQHDKAKTHRKETLGHARMFDEMRSSYLALFFLAILGCKPNAMSKIDAEKAALVSGDAARSARRQRGIRRAESSRTSRASAVFQESCLVDIATGSARRGLRRDPARQHRVGDSRAGAVRDSRGDAFTHPDTWLTRSKTSKGTGHDALRLAIARKMEEASPLVGKMIEGDEASRVALKAIVGAVPGACNTYYLVGNGAAIEKMPPPLHARSFGVRSEGSRSSRRAGRYVRHGIPRALEGALSVWRETERALRRAQAVSTLRRRGAREDASPSSRPPRARSRRSRAPRTRR